MIIDIKSYGFEYFLEMFYNGASKLKVKKIYNIENLMLIRDKHEAFEKKDNKNKQYSSRSTTNADPKILDIILAVMKAQNIKSTTRERLSSIKINKLKEIYDKYFANKQREYVEYVQEIEEEDLKSERLKENIYPKYGNISLEQNYEWEKE